MACRVAGGNDSPEKLWQSLLEKRDASGEIPPMRWEPYYRRDARNAKELSSTTSRGYFLDKLEAFDCSFFGISPKEAEMMDPQQRLSLEVAWEALESAGIPPQSLAGSDTAVFMGVNSDDYSKLLLEDLPDVEAWMGIGTAYCGIPNRISYHLDLMGPSSAVDAACASSLVAIHQGRQAILQGESKIAIVGGVNALCGPGLTKVLDKAGAISKEGCCRSFDDDANGYGRGEGAGVVILKRWEDAIENGDNVLAVLKGSAVAQDGRTNGIMAPNAKAQELVANNALRTANVDPKTVQYVEAHATSTPLGDPTEISAIASVYGKGRAKDDPCFIGSIKPNIGHLEAGAGVMGFIKAVLAINNGVLPPQANLKKLNSQVNWEESGVRVVQDATQWPDAELRRASICSYGYGGTVSHAVIERPNTLNSANQPPEGAVEGASAILLSAPQEKRLITEAKRLQSWIFDSGKQVSLHSIAKTLATRRGHHGHRAAFVASDHEDALAALKSFADGASGAWSTQGRTPSSGTRADTVWVFSGHGAQWKEMGQNLLRNPIFYETIVSLDRVIAPEMGFPAMKALESGDFETSDKVQVLTYAMQIGLSTVLRSKGVKPQAIIGHSVGEIAASVVAGTLTPAEGALIVCRRSQLYRRVAGHGSMILVNSPYADTQKELDGHQDIVVAIDSSPSSCVVSGLSETVSKFAETWKSRGIKTFKVKTDIAFHSPLLDQLVAPLSKALSNVLSPQNPTVKLYSTSSSDPRTESARDSSYWISNMIRPVLLTAAVHAAADDGFRLFLEVSAHPLVSHSINETLMDRGIEDFSAVPTLIRGKLADKCILHAIAQLHCRGADIDWETQMPGTWAPDVPRTTWNHQPLWRVVETGSLNTELTHDVDKHTLLGQRIPLPSESRVIYTSKLDNNTKPFPGNHPLHGTEIIPAAVLVNTFLHGTEARSLSNIVLRVPVAISAPRDIQVIIQQDQVKLLSRLIQTENQVSDDASWVTHTTAHFSKDQIPREKGGDILAIKARIGTQLKNTFSIDYLDSVGVSAMGFSWAITEHFGNEKEMIARVDVAPDAAAQAPLPWDSQSWAPILDAATSVGSTLFFDQPRLRMPAQIDRVVICSQDPPPKTGYLHVQEASGSALAAHVSVLSEEGEILARFNSMRFAEIEGTPGVSGSVESLVHQVAWPPASLAEKPLHLDQAVLISGDDGLAKQYTESLRSQVSYISKLSSAQELDKVSSLFASKNRSTAVFYIPGRVETLQDVAQTTEFYLSQLLDITKFIIRSSLAVKFFVITQNVFKGDTPTALAQSPLHGLSRIVASEQPELWGGLIDTEDSTFPLQAVKYVQSSDVVRVSDTVARTARLRPLPREKLLSNSQSRTLLPRPEGTYLISGGLGALGLEVADFLVEKGARRLVLVSRQGLLPRAEWNKATGSVAKAIAKMKHLESLGATVHMVSVDLGQGNAQQKLSAALERLSLPPILGVVHAAGVLEDQLVLETTASSFHRVLSPKIAGALTLHALFPPKVLDFFILFSSCGQLFGFPGQSSYASGNAFLDTLATHRRNLGDNAIAFQWTSWRGMGMAASTDFINAELESKGITDVTRDDAFRAWTHLAKYDVDHGVVLRSLAFDEGEPLPVPILNDIAIRNQSKVSDMADSAGSTSSDDVPKSGPELKSYLDATIRKCVAGVLQLPSGDDVDSRAALSDLGMDSVMTVGLRKSLQQSLKYKVPPTLTWSHPTVGHLTGWFSEKMAVAVS
ncbi:6-methylsalicylic acid synthase [Loxospora ochrophaea]|nr:6-methylsalicylic acid synthase [Loxospora ochrophaea]